MKSFNTQVNYVLGGIYNVLALETAKEIVHRVKFRFKLYSLYYHLPWHVQHLS